MKRYHLWKGIVLSVLLIGAVGCEQTDDPVESVPTSDLVGSWTYLPATEGDTVLQHIVFDEAGLYSKLEISFNQLHLREDGYYTTDGEDLVLSNGLRRYEATANDLWISSAPGDTLFFARSEAAVDPELWQSNLDLIETHPVNLDRIQGSILAHDGENFWAYAYFRVVQFSLDGDSLSSFGHQSMSEFAYGDGSLWFLENREIVRVDPSSGEAIDSFSLDVDIFATSMTYDDGTLWIRGYGDLWQIDLSSGEILTYPELNFLFSEWVAMYDGHLLALSSDYISGDYISGHYIVEIDKETGLFIKTYKLPEISQRGPFYSLATDGEYLYTLQYYILEQKYVLIKLAFPE